MKALGWWLMLVGSLRLASVWFGFFNIWALRLAVFSKTTTMALLPLVDLAAITWFEIPSCLIRLIINLLSLEFRFNLFRKHTLTRLKAVTEVHGRTFGVWTLLTCTLCFLCAFNLDDKPLYLATFLSFVYALGHFLTEYLIYQSMTVANLSTVGFFAGTSIIWMALQWNAHESNNKKQH